MKRAIHCPSYTYMYTTCTCTLTRSRLPARPSSFSIRSFLPRAVYCTNTQIVRPMTSDLLPVYMPLRRKNQTLLFACRAAPNITTSALLEISPGIKLRWWGWPVYM